MIHRPSICSWQEWETLTEDQRRYELHRVLTALDQRTQELLRIAKWYSFVGGVIGGSLTVLSILGIKTFFGGM